MKKGLVVIRQALFELLVASGSGLADSFKFKGFLYKLQTLCYKLCATNYKVNGAAHDDKILRATAPSPFYVSHERFASSLMVPFSISKR